MRATTDALDQAIDAFLSDRLDFPSFRQSFMDRWAEAGLSAPDLGAYEAAYEVVYMGAAGPPRAADRVVGILSEEEVRVRLIAFRSGSERAG
jgi:hypothetical protein